MRFALFFSVISESDNSMKPKISGLLLLEQHHFLHEMTRAMFNCLLMTTQQLKEGFYQPYQLILLLTLTNILSHSRSSCGVARCLYHFLRLPFALLFLPNKYALKMKSVHIPGHALLPPYFTLHRSLSNVRL